MTEFQDLPAEAPAELEQQPDGAGALDVLYISQYFFPEQFLNNHVAKALIAGGHRVTAICCVPNYPAGRFFEGYSNRRLREEIWNGVDIQRVFTVPRGKSAARLLANYLVYPIAASWKILRLGRRRRGKISFVSMPSPLFQAFAGVFAKKIWNIPTVFWVQDIWPDSAIITLRMRNPFAIAILNAICGWLYRQADLVMVQSDGFHSRISGFGVSPDRIVTLPNFAPDSFFPVEPSQVPDRIRSLFPRNRRIVMFAGNIGESQDFDTIVEAAALLSPGNDMLIAVVGSGRDEVRVRALVSEKKLEDRFLFLGRHPEADMPFFFACADAMLVSLRDEPIFALTVPSKVQAYLACGKPILASLAGEGSAIVESAQAGKVVAPSSPEALCDGFLYFSRAPEVELRAMGENARSVYNAKYSLPAIMEILEKSLADILR